MRCTVANMKEKTNNKRETYREWGKEGGEKQQTSILQQGKGSEKEYI